jgi:hypothetical protein
MGEKLMKSVVVKEETNLQASKSWKNNNNKMDLQIELWLRVNFHFA